jgi:hypothetical protein
MDGEGKFGSILRQNLFFVQDSLHPMYSCGYLRRMPGAVQCRAWSADNSEPEIYLDARPAVSAEWLNFLQIFPRYFQRYTLARIRRLLSRDLQEHDSMGAVTIGWKGNTIFRLITADRQLVQIAIGQHADFAVYVLCPDVDSRSSKAWEPFLSHEHSLAFLRDIGFDIHLPEDLTPEAAEIRLLQA